MFKKSKDYARLRGINAIRQMIAERNNSKYLVW